MTELRLHGECSITPFDTPLGQVVAPGDWIATANGSRYLVLSAHLVRVTTRRRKDHAQRNRHRLRCARLDKNLEPPDDVKVWWLTWYPRKRR
jgi:hypothetical protein